MGTISYIAFGSAVNDVGLAVQTYFNKYTIKPPQRCRNQIVLLIACWPYCHAIHDCQGLRRHLSFHSMNKCLGPSWALRGPTVCPSWACEGLKLGPIMGLERPLLGPIMAQVWAHHGPMRGPSLGPSWALRGPSVCPSWACGGPSLAPSWALSGPKPGPNHEATICF